MSAMSDFLLAGMIAALILGTAGAADPPEKPPFPGDAKDSPKLEKPPEKIAADLLRSHNKIRDRIGKPAFRMDRRLNSAAQKFARFLAKEGKLEHDADGRNPGLRIDDEGYEWASYGENLARGIDDSQEAVDAWMSSGPHRENIVGDEEQIGFGVADGVWVAVFSTLSKRAKAKEKKMVKSKTDE